MNEDNLRFTLRKILERMSRFQKVSVYYGNCGECRTGHAGDLREHLDSKLLDSGIGEIKAHFSEFQIYVID